MWDALADWAKAGISFLALGVSVGAFFYKRSSRKEDQLERRLNDGQHTMDALENRVTALETEMRSLPTHGDIGALRDTIAGVDSKLSQLNGTMTALERSVGMIHQFLLEGGRKS